MRYLKNKNIFYLVIPFILALLGINYGLPLHLVGDEESLIGGALKMIELRQPFPVLAPEQFKFLYYPPIIPYLYVLAALPVLIFKLLVSGFDIVALKDYFITNLDIIWLSARLMTAIFSLGVLLVVYRLAKSIFSQQAAYLSVALLACSFFQVLLAGQARHWVFTAFFAYLTVLLALLSVRGSIKKYYLIGLIAGIGFGTTYVTIFGLMAAVLVLWFYRHQIQKPFKKIFVTLSLATIIGASLILLNLPDLLRLNYGGETIGEPLKKDFIGFTSHINQVVKVLFNQELLILFLATLSLFLWKRHTRLKIFILVIFLAYCGFLYYFLHFEIRYVYLMMPALIILAVDTLIFLAEKIKNQKLYYFILSLLFLWPVLGVMNYTRLVLADDTRELALKYISQEIKNNNFLLVSPYLYLPRTSDSLAVADYYGHINAVERYRYNNYERLISDIEQEYDYQNVHFWSQEFQNSETIDEYLVKYQPDYFVLEYWSDDEIEDYYSSLRQRAVLVKILRQSKLSKDYDINGNYWVFNSVLFDLERLGPTIEIYKLLN